MHMCPHLAFACATTIFVTYRVSSVECQCVHANFGRLEFVYIAFPAASRAFHALPPFTLYDMVYASFDSRCLSFGRLLYSAVMCVTVNPRAESLLAAGMGFLMDENTGHPIDYDGKAPGDLPRTAAKETRGRAPLTRTPA